MAREIRNLTCPSCGETKPINVAVAADGTLGPIKCRDCHLRDDLPGEKHTTYWRVKSAADPSGKPEWTELEAPLIGSDGLVGDLQVENDDQIMLIYFEDKAAQERVTRASRDAAALAREHEIPHRPWDTPSS